MPAVVMTDLMLRKARNARTDHLTDWRFFFQIDLPCAMSMWFLYMDQHGLGFYDVILVYDKWTVGWKGFSIERLTHLVSLRHDGVHAVRRPACGTDPPRIYSAVEPALGAPPEPGCGGRDVHDGAVVNLFGPALQGVFGTTPIPSMFRGIPFAFVLAILVIDETRKAVVRMDPTPGWHVLLQSFVAKMAW
ncbi:hypothetical protein A0H81_13829 [Grifola frondosa]|uniref:Uncharacterized protein n=1 Tax=Grifola frondosa TaxID=5627 RepID=A0A1C7LN48_GRIFR|nr:hypothetical protein A0H81_13829 [Grifola frondosa]